MSSSTINQLLNTISGKSSTINNGSSNEADNQLVTLLVELLTQLLNNQNNLDQSSSTTTNKPDPYKLIIDLVPNPYHTTKDPYAPQQIRVARSHDLNEDKILDEQDLHMMQEFVKGKINLTEDQIKVGDFNGDEKVDNIDVDILTERLKKRAYGDVNGDRRVNERDLEISQDFTYGRDSRGTLTLAEIIAASGRNPYLPAPGYNPYSPSKEWIAFAASTSQPVEHLIAPREKGDINNDTKINQADLEVFTRLDDMHILSDAQIEAADLDGDGVFNEDKDLPLLKGMVEKNKLTVKPPKKKKKKKH